MLQHQSGEADVADKDRVPIVSSASKKPAMGRRNTLGPSTVGTIDGVGFIAPGPTLHRLERIFRREAHDRFRPFQKPSTASVGGFLSVGVAQTRLTIFGGLPPNRGVPVRAEWRECQITLSGKTTPHLDPEQDPHLAN